ncbi:leucine-rich repeat-containing protein kinase family protein [Ochrovirga pacifica]|uniref:leucine-rich repeat-containing protein kinase family protein n=1 Tax=Ochrovirga pacifica TaxID=1042376 RepID=UPI0002558E76|nr:leucine-rich repeat-containing protein kinase family protein [Ochrovirga pacifica]
MLHTLEALKSGALLGSKKVKLACGLSEFPQELFTLANSLEILDLSDNNLSELPKNMSDFKHLKIVFFARNKFQKFPSELADCPELSMVGFRSNQIKEIPEHVFPKKLRWLILTDNKITYLPNSIGTCSLLQKCGLAGNQLLELPEAMANCKNLELLRISCNQLQKFPLWLFQLPKLAWIAFSGNPATHQPEQLHNLASYHWQDFELNTLLGEGASGVIYKALWKSKSTEVAIKLFKGTVTTDGLPEDEMKVSIATGLHLNLIPVIGQLKHHPEQQKGLVMELIPAECNNLGNPPSLATCTRDTFDKGTSFSSRELLHICQGIASVAAHLHKKGIQHGDLYAHNILIHPSGKAILGDFGAASFYDVRSSLSKFIERVEVRAFGCLVEDILQLTSTNTMPPEKRTAWEALITVCCHPTVDKRPCFSEIVTLLKNI